MVIRFLILIFFFCIKFSYSSIIYDKNEITITEIEITKYIDLHNINFGSNISINQAIKNIVLMKRTISDLLNDNPEFLSILDKKIVSEYSEDVLNDKNVLNFIRFQKIRNEFISEYFRNNFNLEDLEIIFANLNNLKIPVSKNNCMTIEKLYELNNDKYFIENFFKNLRNDQQNYTTLIDNEMYDVCMNNKLFKNIESEIIKFIENKTENDFDKFIYGKIN
tara:strand:- start:399 stop:1061 length:663 start_codon:yes stop_codon:yes gene_type:complete